MRSAYRPSLYDRLGDRAGEIAAAAGWSLYGGGAIGAIAGVRIGMLQGFGAPLLVLLGLVGAAIGCGLGIGFALALSHTAGAGTALFVYPQGEYQSDYSFEESLAARGDVAGAITEFEKRITAEPDNPQIRLRVAELLARPERNPARAAELLREVQRLPRATTSERLYATNRLVDLYVGPLRDVDKALAELRRLINAYPRSTEAGRYARAALLELKRQQRESAD